MVKDKKEDLPLWIDFKSSILKFTIFADQKDLLKTEPKLNKYLIKIVAENTKKEEIQFTIEVSNDKP